MGCHFLLQHLPDPGIKPASPVFPAFAGWFFFSSAHSISYRTTVLNLKIVQFINLFLLGLLSVTQGLFLTLKSHCI